MFEPDESDNREDLSEERSAGREDAKIGREDADTGMFDSSEEKDAREQGFNEQKTADSDQS